MSWKPLNDLNLTLAGVTVPMMNTRMYVHFSDHSPYGGLSMALSVVHARQTNSFCPFQGNASLWTTVLSKSNKNILRPNQNLQLIPKWHSSHPPNSLFKQASHYTTSLAWQLISESVVATTRTAPSAFARWIQKLGRSLAGTSRTECCGFDQCNPTSLLLVPLNGESQAHYFDATILTKLKRKRKIRKESTPKPFAANPRTVMVRSWTL